MFLLIKMPYKFSPSSLSLLKDCSRCFWLNFNKEIKRPDSIFPSLPSGMDRVLKAHFDSFRDRKLLPPELKEFNGDIKLFDNVELLDIGEITSKEYNGKTRKEICSKELLIISCKKEKSNKPYDKSNFEYDKDKDEYICPEGKSLVFQREGFDKRKIFGFTKEQLVRPALTIIIALRKKME